MKLINIALVFLFSANVLASEKPQTTKAEIEHLFQYLEESGCQFNRNGVWYTPIEAVDHIKTKYEYLLGKDMISTTESFIEKAATKSSMSGEQYQVKCENQAAVPSSTWFAKELKKYREI